MLLTFFWSVLNSTVVYAYPAYASFKTLSRRPASEPQLERWLMYWSVVGCIVALEYIAEWSISWIPFYWLLKTVFLLWLALPQTQGATYIYQRRLAPLLTEYEPTIDAHMGQYKTKLYTFVQDKLRFIWQQISGQIAQHTGVNLNMLDPAATGPAQGTNPENMGQGAQVMMGLWRTWGPGIINALQPPAPTQQDQAAAPSSTLAVPSAQSRPSSRSANQTPDLDTIRSRRRQVEAELARLTAMEQRQEGALPTIPSSSNIAQSMYLSDAGSASEASFGTSARDAGRYEEINRDEVSDESEEGNSSSRPAAPARWSFWGKSPSGYTPLKDD